MSRVVPNGNWLKGWLYWMKESEAPDSYLLWAGLSAISGCTQRKVYVKWVYHYYYTNQYIMLIGPAGIVHKSSTIDMVRQMYREAEIPTTSEALTKEALIEQMIKRGEVGVSALTALPDEFSDFVRPSGPPMIEFLTSIYGCQEVWEYTTRLRGTEQMEKAFLNLFAGTTPRWIANEFDATFVEGGFASRTIFIHETEPRFRKAKVIITEDMIKMYNLLLEDLHHISQIEGEFMWEGGDDGPAFSWFADWYEKDMPGEIKSMDYRLRGYTARKPTHMLKLAMSLQLSVSDELIITQENIKKAKQLFDGLEESMTQTFSAVGRNIYANDLERIYSEVMDAGGRMVRSEIVSRNYSAMPKMALDEQLQTLLDMGKLRKELGSDGKLYYMSTEI
jgi:hypothetical protein